MTEPCQVPERSTHRASDAPRWGVPGAVVPIRERPTVAASSGRVIVGLALTAGLMTAAWHHTFREMWLRWHPAWTFSHYPVLERLTLGDSYYSHGLLVPLVSVLVAVAAYRRVGLPVGRSRSGTAMGWLLLVTFLTVHLVGVYARVTFVSGFALIGVLGGLILCWGGWPLLRVYAWPVALLVFMVPLPMSWVADLNFLLKIQAGSASLWLTNEIFQVPAVMDGSFIHLLPDAAGHSRSLVMENVCSGLRSLVSLSWFASLLALVCRLSLRWRIGLLAAAAPIALACNVVRITIMTVACHLFGTQVVHANGWLHAVSGLCAFAGALVLLTALERMIASSGRMLGRDWTDDRLFGFLSRTPRTGWTTLAVWRPTTLGALVVTAGLSVLWARPSVARAQGDRARQAVPRSITINDVFYSSMEMELSEGTRIMLETDDYAYRRYVAVSGANAGRSFDLLIVFSPDNRKGTHPPEVCLEARGDHIIARQTHTLDVDGVGCMTLRELISQRGTQQTCHLYVYKCGDHYTPNFFNQQAAILLNGLISRSAAGALIRFSVPVAGRQVDEARSLALAACGKLMRSIHERLP